MKVHVKWIYIVAFSSILLLILLCLPGMGESAFGIDDAGLFDQKFLKTPWTWDSLRILLTPGYSPDYYPVRDLSVWLDWTFTKNVVVNTTVPKVQNFLWLLGIAFLTFKILKKLTHHALFSMIMACAWFLHPFHFESLHWISARKDLMAWFFTLASAYCVLPGFLENKQLSGKSMGAALLLFTLGLLSKATFLALPFVLFGWMGWKYWVEKKRDFFPGSFRTVFIGMLLSVVFVAVNYWNYTKNNYMKMTETTDVRMLSVMAAFGRNIVGIFVPNYNAVDVEPWGNWWVFHKPFVPIGILGLVILAALIAWGLKKKISRWLLFTGVIVGILAMTPGFNPNHRNYYSIRYFEPVFYILFIWFSLWLVHTRHALRWSLAILVFIAATATLDADNWDSNFNIVNKSLKISREDPSIQAMMLLEYYNLATWGRLDKEEMKTYYALYHEVVQHCVEDDSLDPRCLAFMRRLREFAAFLEKSKERRAELMSKAHDKVIKIKQKVFSEVATAEVAWTVFDFKLYNEGVIDMDSLRIYFAEHQYLTDDFSRVRYLVFQCLEKGPEQSFQLYSKWLAEQSLRKEEVHEFISDLKQEPLRTSIQKCFKLNK